MVKIFGTGIGIAVIALGSTGCEQVTAQSPAANYQMVAAKGSTPAEDRAWILDTKTGSVRLCYESAAAIHCLTQSGPPAAERN